MAEGFHSLNMHTNEDIVPDILRQYPGFKAKFSPENFKVIDASLARKAINPQMIEGRQSEFYKPTDKGGIEEDMLPHPSPGNYAVEIYNQKDYGTYDTKRNLVMGEMLHGMHDVPAYGALREQFANSFDPEVVSRIKGMMDDKTSDFAREGPNETYDQMMNRSGTDAYIRAGFWGDKEFTQDYTPQQSSIIQQMQQMLAQPPTPSSTVSDFIPQVPIGAP